jgi:NO-binding membrane sensor protein with MHYT domain
MAPMGMTTETGFGWATPLLAYLMVCVGSGLGLRCTTRALAAGDPRSKRNWLIAAAVSLAGGIWTMQFIAMLGFAVSGTPIRYAVGLTVLSLAVAVLTVGAGVFVVGYWGSRTRALLVGGVVTGLGVALVHYIGMSAMRLNGRMGFNVGLVVLSLVIAVIAATIALWAVLTIHSPSAAVGASLVMGIAISAMHYTGMSAAQITVTPGLGPNPGATAMQFIFPLIVGIGSALFLTSAFVSLSPIAPLDRAPLDRAPRAAAETG